jgi:hypothetical protein
MRARKWGALLLASGLLSATAAATDSAAAPVLSNPPQESPVLPPELVALEQKMGQLEVNSERYTEATTTAGRIVLHVARGKRRTRATHSTSQFSGEVSLSQAEGELVGSDGEPQQIAFGSALFLHWPALDREDGGRPWVRLEHGSAALLFPFHGGPSSPLQEKAGGTGSYAGLIDLIATAVGTVEEVGPATVVGQQTIEFTVPIDPYALTKDLPSSVVGKLRARFHFRLDVFITEAGLPVRVVEVVSEDHGGSDILSSSTTEITATEVPVSIQPPPARETISAAALKRLKTQKGLSNLVTFVG